MKKIAASGGPSRVSGGSNRTKHLNIHKAAGLAGISLILASCAEMEVEQFNDQMMVSMGGTCLSKVCEYYVYNETTGEYDKNSMITTKDGLDASAAESQWIQGRLYAFANRELGPIHETSPVTGGSYKFMVKCQQWQQPPQQQAPAYPAYTPNQNYYNPSSPSGSGTYPYQNPSSYTPYRPPADSATMGIR